MVEHSDYCEVGTTSTARSGLLQIVQANETIGGGKGNISIFTSNAQAIDIGGMLALGGQSGETNWLYGSVSGRSENNSYAGYLQFGSSLAAGSHSEAMRINSNQEVLIGTATRTANGGKLQISNGITFPATAVACTDANTLDDYEEGTWTPTLISGVTTTVGTFAATGTYTKIGKLVTFSFVQTSGTITWTTARLGGLPFTVATISVGAITNQTGPDINHMVLIYSNSNLYIQGSQTVGQTEIVFSGSYTV